MEKEMEIGEKFLRLLYDLYAEQESIKIEYTITKRNSNNEK